MIFYTPLEYVSLLMELDSLVEGDFHQFKEDALRKALHRTIIAMGKLWGIPSPSSLMSPVAAPTSLSMLIEARRSQHVIFARRGLLIFHVDPKFRDLIALNRLLIKQRQQIDDMIVRELGISEKDLPECCVVAAGGVTQAELESEMLQFF